MIVYEFFKEYRYTFAAIGSTVQEYRLTSNTITLKRGESKNIVFAVNDNSLVLLKEFHNNIIASNNRLAKYNFFGKFGNKLYLELTDGAKIKIDNRIPQHVPN